MVFSADSSSAGSSSQKPGQVGGGGGGVELNDLWRVSNPSMPPQASPVVDRAGKVASSQKVVLDDSLPNLPKVKCVLVGDGTIGKTSLVVSYTTNGYPTEYVPTAFDNYSVMVTVDNSPLRIQLCDTAGQDDFDSLRPLCYPNTDIFLLCFSVVSPTSFHNINDKWIAEIHDHCPKVPILLIGTQCDLRNDVKVLIELAQYNDKPITEEEGKLKAQEIGALDYIECSALTQKHLKLVFDTAILAAVERKGGALGKKTHSSKKAQKYKCSSDAQLLHNKGALALKAASPKLRTKQQKASRPRRGWRKMCCFA